jgi:hypothetical protein
MKDTIRAVSIVLNVLALGALILEFRDRGIPDGNQGILVLVLFLAPLSSLVALWWRR